MTAAPVARAAARRDTRVMTQRLRVHNLAVSVDGYTAGLTVVEHVSAPAVTHVVLGRS